MVPLVSDDSRDATGGVNDLKVVDLEVTLPDRKATSFGAYSSRKPLAEVRLVLDNDDERAIVVPVRVGRLLIKEGFLPLPIQVDEAFDRIHSLERSVCFTMLTEMLSRRDHGTEEVRSKLASYGFRPQEIEPSIKRAADMHFLNDSRFIESFIEERKRRGWGERKVSAELRMRGIDVSAIPGYPEAFFDGDDDAARAYALVSKRRIPDARPFEKLVRFLMGKGFSYAIASDAVRRRIDE